MGCLLTQFSNNDEEMGEKQQSLYEDSINLYKEMVEKQRSLYEDSIKKKEKCIEELLAAMDKYKKYHKEINSTCTTSIIYIEHMKKMNKKLMSRLCEIQKIAQEGGSCEEILKLCKY